MGNIGPARQRFDVLPIPEFGIDDADRWSLAPRPPRPTMTVPSPQPMPAPHPQPMPEPVPMPDPAPLPDPGPGPSPTDPTPGPLGRRAAPRWLRRAGRAPR
jgi:hypothetical protein